MIECLRLRNFRRHRDTTLRFEPGLNFIEGLNNVGKTTLFYAIEYALFGRVENFKTIRSVMQTGKRSIGVELIFAGPKGERYLLQRVHLAPSKSKKALEGHFTLKALADDTERYLLASDFGDTEDKLALALQELTGLTRRLFSIALHMRQGDIATILDGARQLDIVLGVTAASMAEDELRQMALELEKESAGLPVFEERIRALANDRGKVGEEFTTLTAERQATAEKLAALGNASDPRLEIDNQLAPLLAALSLFQKRRDDSELTRQRLADEQERKAESVRSGSPEEVAKELAKLEADATARVATMNRLRSDLDQVEAEQRKLDQQRGDLSGRIERRKGLPLGKGAKCEVCGAAIKPAQMAKELAEWSENLAQIDQSLAEWQAKHLKLRTSLEQHHAEERKQLNRTAQLTKQRERLTELDANIARRQQELDVVGKARTEAFGALQAEAKILPSLLQGSSFEARLALDGEPDGVVVSIRETIQAFRQSLSERVGRQLAERQALADLLKRFEAQAQSIQQRQNDLEREQAAALAQASALQIKAARAARFRRLSSAFKDLQVQIRSDAATKLAGDALALHRQLSERDEFEALSIDPAHYTVQVVPRDLGEEVPAGLYEGGGQRLLLGLAFRLAVARLVGHCPFLMLDEPTYGLDLAHRQALLERIGTQNLAKQVLLVTHHAKPDIPGHRIQVVRQDRETVAAPTDGAPATNVAT
jgi:exonuclease SbcC